MKIKIDVAAGPRSTMLGAEAILAYLLGTDDRLDSLILCKPSDVELLCFDQSLYEALGSLKDHKEFNYRRLVKFLESVDIISFKANMRRARPVLKHARVKELRDRTLAKKERKVKKDSL